MCKGHCPIDASSIPFRRHLFRERTVCQLKPFLISTYPVLRWVLTGSALRIMFASSTAINFVYEAVEFLFCFVPSPLDNVITSATIFCRSKTGHHETLIEISEGRSVICFCPISLHLLVFARRYPGGMRCIGLIWCNSRQDRCRSSSSPSGFHPSLLSSDTMTFWSPSKPSCGSRRPHGSPLVILLTRHRKGLFMFGVLLGHTLTTICESVRQF